MQRLSAQAYEALRKALPTITWYKPAFQSYLTAALRGHPELLVGIDFQGVTKREAADQLLDRVMANEARYQRTTIDLMCDIASMNRFPDVEQIKEPVDRKLRLDQAEEAVGHLRTIVAPYRDARDAARRSASAKESYEDRRTRIKRFDDDLAELKQRYLDLHSVEPRSRGLQLEPLLTDLFLIFDMEPRLTYNLPLEQIDGSLSFDTDDYIVEARWRAKPTSRGDLDVFKAKVERKGRNALGLFVSVNAFSGDALAAFGIGTACPFVVLTGEDLFHVLDGRLRLGILLKAKKRHVNETGDCYMPATRLL